MSQIDVVEIRRVLEAKYRELSSAACNRDDIAIESTAEEMEKLQQQLTRDIAIRSLNHTSMLLKSVQAAIDRIQDGTYGVCLHCEEPIHEKRLKAVPWASYCVVCEEMIDSHRKRPGDDFDAIAFAA